MAAVSVVERVRAEPARSQLGPPVAPVAPVPPVAGRGRWVAACLAGEAVGIGGTAAVAGLLAATMGEPHGLAARLTVWSAMVAAGGVEGLALGGFTWLVLRRQLPSLPARRWVGGTVALAVAGWALGMLPSTVASDEAAAGGGPGGWLLVLFAVGGGLAAGAAFGAVQAWALRGHATGLAGWVAVNAVAWTLALSWIFAVAAWPTAGSPTAVLAVVGVIAGLGSGLTVGLVTGLWLPQLRPIRPA